MGHWLSIVGASILLGCASLSLLMSSCRQIGRRLTHVPGPSIASPQGATATVRVRLASGPEPLRISSLSAARWLAGEDARELLSGKGPWSIARAPGGNLTVGGRELPVRSAALQPQGGLFRLGERTYRGSLVVTAETGGGLTAVEVVPIEDYLRSVVACEMSAHWALDALKAQAVAARTYAVFRLHPKGHARPYLTHVDLAYGGVHAETHAADRAVRETAGIVMNYKGRLFPAYFHSTCGGMTTSAAHVWDEAPTAPLAGVPCGWCTRSQYFRWTASFTAAEIAAALVKQKVEGAETVEQLTVEGVDAAGYARSVIVNGKTEVNANGFRLAVGSDKLRSCAFEIHKRGDVFEFKGGGWGHGVGLCQWGARGMADAGMHWRGILQHFYPGIAIVEPGGE